MKNFSYFFLLIFLNSCISNSESVSDELITVDSLQSELISKNEVLKALEFENVNNDSIVNLYALYLQKIKDNISEINKQELLIKNTKNNPDFIKSDTTDIIESIKILSKKLQENESMIMALNNAVSKEKSKNSQFASRVLALNEEIAKSNREVYFLREELNSLNASFETVFNKYTIQNQTINKLNEKLNEVAYVYGSKSELLKNGILSKNGGIMGIGKSRKLNSDLNTDYFSYVSKYDFESLQLGFKIVKIITPHPSYSYKLSTNNDVVDSLIILNQNEFWKNSKFLVLEVK